MFLLCEGKSSSGNVVQKQEPVLYTKSVSPSKTFIHSSDNQKKSGDHLALSSKNSDLNPDIKDIQLLASMQEQGINYLSLTVNYFFNHFCALSLKIFAIVCNK